jgi:O-antigen/teichoic acid export membrane protein
MHEALLLFAFRLAVVGLVIGAPFGPTVGGASLSYAVATLPAIVGSGFLLRSAVRGAGSSSATARAIVRQAAPLGVNGYLSLLSTRVELFLLQAFSGAEAVGLFGGALRIVESLLTLPSAIAAGALPSVSRDVVQGSRGAAQRTFGLVVWMGVPAALGLGLCAHDVLRVLGPAFVDGAAALRILSAALFLCFANAVLFHILIAAGQTAIVPRLTASRVAVACLAGSLLVPAFGLVGAALSFCAAELFLFSALVARTRAHASIHVGRPVAWALTACLPMTALLWLHPLPLPLAIAAGGSSFAVAAAVILRRGTEASGLA